jgi:hypothetical protein
MFNKIDPWLLTVVKLLIGPDGWCGTCYPGDLNPGSEGYCDKYGSKSETGSKQVSIFEISIPAIFFLLFHPRTDAMIFRNIFFPKSLAKVLAILPKLLLFFHHIGFGEKNAAFSAEDWQKSLKIVLIIKTSGILHKFSFKNCRQKHHLTPMGNIDEFRAIQSKFII